MEVVDPSLSMVEQWAQMELQLLGGQSQIQREVQCNLQSISWGEDSVGPTDGASREGCGTAEGPIVLSGGHWNVLKGREPVTGSFVMVEAIVQVLADRVRMKNGFAQGLMENGLRWFDRLRALSLDSVDPNSQVLQSSSHPNSTCLVCLALLSETDERATNRGRAVGFVKTLL